MGTTVLIVQARDLDQGANADIRYKLSNDVFNIHPVKGIITVRQGLGSVTDKKYEFSVIATDQGTPNRQTAVSVSVTVHSLSYIPPKFLRPVYRKVVPENFKIGTVLLTVHAQKSVGLGTVEYFIVGGDPQNRFIVGTRSGVLTLRKQLDYEKMKQRVLVVRAVQKGLSRGQPSLPKEVSEIQEQRIQTTLKCQTKSITEKLSLLHCKKQQSRLLLGPLESIKGVVLKKLWCCVVIGKTLYFAVRCALVTQRYFHKLVAKTST